MIALGGCVGLSVGSVVSTVATDVYLLGDNVMYGVGVAVVGKNEGDRVGGSVWG